MVWNKEYRGFEFFSYHHFHADVAIDAVHEDVAKNGL